MSYETLFDDILFSQTNPNGLSTENFGLLINFLGRTTTAKGELNAWQATPNQQEPRIVFSTETDSADYDPFTNTIRLNPNEFNNANFLTKRTDWVTVIAHEVKHAVNYVEPTSSEFAILGVEGLNDEALGRAAEFVALWEIGKTAGPALDLPTSFATRWMYEQIANNVKLLGPDATAAQVQTVATGVALIEAAQQDYMQLHGGPNPPPGIADGSIMASDINGDGRADVVFYRIEGTENVAGFSYTYPPGVSRSHRHIGQQLYVRHQRSVRPTVHYHLVCHLRQSHLPDRTADLQRGAGCGWHPGQAHFNDRWLWARNVDGAVVQQCGRFKRGATAERVEGAGHDEYSLCQQRVRRYRESNRRSRPRAEDV